MYGYNQHEEDSSTTKVESTPDLSLWYTAIQLILYFLNDLSKDEKKFLISLVDPAENIKCINENIYTGVNSVDKTNNIIYDNTTYSYNGFFSLSKDVRNWCNKIKINQYLLNKKIITRYNSWPRIYSINDIYQQIPIQFKSNTSLDNRATTLAHFQLWCDEEIKSAEQNQITALRYSNNAARSDNKIYTMCKEIASDLDFNLYDSIRTESITGKFYKKGDTIEFTSICPMCTSSKLTPNHLFNCVNSTNFKRTAHLKLLRFINRNHLLPLINYHQQLYDYLIKKEKITRELLLLDLSTEFADIENFINNLNTLDFRVYCRENANNVNYQTLNNIKKFNNKDAYDNYYNNMMKKIKKNAIWVLNPSIVNLAQLQLTIGQLSYLDVRLVGNDYILRGDDDEDINNNPHWLPSAEAHPIAQILFILHSAFYIHEVTSYYPELI